MPDWQWVGFGGQVAAAPMPVHDLPAAWPQGEYKGLTILRCPELEERWPEEFMLLAPPADVVMLAGEPGAL